MLSIVRIPILGTGMIVPYLLLGAPTSTRCVCTRARRCAGVRAAAGMRRMSVTD